jgi:hypothetical protein
MKLVGWTKKGKKIVRISKGKCKGPTCGVKVVVLENEHKSITQTDTKNYADRGDL